MDDGPLTDPISSQGDWNRGTEEDWEEEVFDQGQADLADRISLRRIEGIRTDIADISEVEYRQLRLERVVLVGIGARTMTDDEIQRSFAELKLLAETAGSHVLAGLMQRRNSPDPATYIGRGKVAEVKLVVAETEADTVIFDSELAPAQLRNLEDQVGVKVIDRTALILDIFAQHAKSDEGKAQVELAQLTYLRSRLRGWGGNLSRQVGGRASGGAGIGGRGPGETKIETDRRRISTRISRLRGQLAKMQATREVKRASRVASQVPSVAIVGYTNAGKSSLLNVLTAAEVLVDDSLFATLDPTTRRTQTESGREYTLTDTVGFIRRLPTDLVESFASTLEESVNADLLVHVVDGSDPDPVGQVAAVREVLGTIDADDIPELLVLNKMDLVGDDVRVRLRTTFPQAVFISVKTGEGLDELRARVEADIPELETLVTVLIPYDRGDLVDRMHRRGTVVTTEHQETGTLVTARVDSRLLGVLEEYVV
ncbi:MAG: GTPase HflX [Propionibacteriaceae bacterium]|jgi:GTP-binding protein HflX|nr:GTPase HflX [Propionibacteriaceae bacterium]